MLRSLGKLRTKAPSVQSQRFASGVPSRAYEALLTSLGRVFIASGKRTPFGKFGGSAKDITPVDLTVHSAKAALEEAKIPATDIGTTKAQKAPNSR